MSTRETSKLIRRPAVIATVVAVGGLSLFLGGWPLLADRAAGDLDIHTFASRHCTVEPQTANGPRVTVEPRTGLHCVLSVQVVNNGSHAVRVDTLRGYGIAVGSHGVRAVSAGGIRPYEVSPEPVKTIYAVHETIAPGRTRAFKMALVDDPRGCKPGGTLISSSWPGVQVHVLGRTREVYSSTALALRNIPSEPRGEGCR